MAIGFIMWSMASFDKQDFAICGRTIEALRRNVIVHIPAWLEGMFEVTERRSENKMVVTIGNRSNTYYLFGGRDESSYTLIQGITLAGVLFDEVALMPRSFVEQAMARCSVSGSKFWFNCNPESPGHWFYKEWIRSDDVSPIFIETEDNLRTFNTNELTRKDNIFILFSSVDDGPVMVVSSQRLHDMLNPTKDTNWNSTYIYKSRHEMLPVNLTQETLFSSKSHGKYALFPIFTASWRAHRIMNKGV